VGSYPQIQECKKISQWNVKLKYQNVHFVITGVLYTKRSIIVVI
jgi:hypothetical protein